MKRSQTINLDRMRKTIGFKKKPLALGIAIASFLVGCSSGGGGMPNEGEIFRTLEDCKLKYPQAAQQCEDAYSHAMQVAQDTAPKYASMNDCARDFGRDQCVVYRNNNGSNWFMPFMAGYVVAELIDGIGGRRSAPLFTSYSSSSPYYYRWTTADGYSYGNYRTGKVKLNRQTFKPKPKVTKTIKRGGFGSKVAAKSKWGGSKSSSRSGWGG